MGREGGDQSVLGRSHDSQGIRREGGEVSRQQSIKGVI